MQLIIGILIIIIIVLLIYRRNLNELNYQKISVDEAHKIIAEEDVIIVDVRENNEYKSGHIKNAICIPNESISHTEISQLPVKSQTILVYCHSGKRSRKAANKLIKLGYENVFDCGGIIDWNGEIVR